MARDDLRSRRTVLRVGGGTAVAAVLAGCGSGGPGGNGDEAGEGTEPDGGSGNEPLEPGEIRLGGEAQGWQGQEPEELTEEANPALVLQEGESYEITWENLDGEEHNLQILGDDEEVVEDYETEFVSEESETRTLEIDAVTSEMASYVCGEHEAMNGEIDVQ